MLGDFLYQLTEKDARTQPVLQRRMSRQTAAAASVSLVLFTELVPNDKALLVTHLTATAISGAAQNCTAMLATVRDQANNILGQIGRPTGDLFAFAPTQVVYTWPGLHCLMMPNERLQVDFTFDAGAAVNNAEFGMFGYYIPRGTLQLR